MTVAILRGGRAKAEDISILEDVIGQPLSRGFREFVTLHDGGSPESNRFPVSPEIESGVNQFIPVKSISRERNNIENISSHAYPFAWAEGGNYLIIDEGRQGQIIFWDHEEPEKHYRIADDFDAFIACLYPFDISSVKLAPDQVQSAWINPNFLKKLSK